MRWCTWIDALTTPSLARRAAVPSEFAPSALLEPPVCVTAVSGAAHVARGANACRVISAGRLRIVADPDPVGSSSCTSRTIALLLLSEPLDHCSGHVALDKREIRENFRAHRAS